MTFARLLLLAILLAVSAPAQGAETVYPTGSRVGLAPPPGLTPSSNFSGFEDRDNRVAVVLVALPAEAYAPIEKSSASDLLAKQGMNVEAREDVAHPLGKAFLVVGRQQIESVQLRKWVLVLGTSDITAIVTVQMPEEALSAYPEAAIRGALSTVSVRSTVPVEEQLALLPFRVTELAGFKIGGVMPGRALMLTDGAAGGAGPVDTHMVVAIAPGGPAQASERENFAREVFATIPNLKDVRLTSSETIRISGQQGHQIMAQGRDESSSSDVTIVQWIRFGGGAYLHLIGVARSDGWLPAYGRFRQVRDGIAPR
jgi:hypothetical protein